jgi:hypothetical protein
MQRAQPLRFQRPLHSGRLVGLNQQRAAERPAGEEIHILLEGDRIAAGDGTH